MNNQLKGIEQIRAALRHALDLLRAHESDKSGQLHGVRHEIPYGFHVIHTEIDHLILVNRLYKPIGMSTGEWVNYDDFPALAASRKELAFILPFLQPVKAGYFFFNDESAPWCSPVNCKRLINLLERSMREVTP